MYSRLPVQYAELAFTPTQGPCSRITCAATATRRLHALMSQVVAAAIDEAEAISHTFPHTSPKWENEPLMIPIGYNVWEMYGKSLLFSPRNVHFTLSKMTIANQTQLTSICFGCDRAALSASSLVGELSVTLRDLPHTLFGSLASNAAPIRYNLRIVTDIAIVGPRTLVTAGT